MELIHTIVILTSYGVDPHNSDINTAMELMHYNTDKLEPYKCTPKAKDTRPDNRTGFVFAIQIMYRVFDLVSFTTRNCTKKRPMC